MLDGDKKKKKKKKEIKKSPGSTCLKVNPGCQGLKRKGKKGVGRGQGEETDDKI